MLTEAATGNYSLTPLIAAFAGADKVYAMTRDSRYATAAEASEQVMNLAEKWNLAKKIEVLFTRNDPRIGKADIVTNLGFVRPLNAALLTQLKPTAVIPLMWETWEFRPEDIDLDTCRQLKLPVLGTNEHHESLQIFGYIGHLALKCLYHLEIEVFRSTIVVLGSGEFADIVIDTLRSADAEVIPLDTSKVGILKTDHARSSLRSADGLVVVEHHHYRCLIGPTGEMLPSELFAINPALAVAHISGGVDRDSLLSAGIKCFPAWFAPPGYMSIATDYLGPKPLIDLHTAGLKVGELAARARLSGLPWSEFLATNSGYSDLIQVLE